MTRNMGSDRVIVALFILHVAVLCAWKVLRPTSKLDTVIAVLMFSTGGATIYRFNVSGMIHMLL